jgi:hypothetical protein
MRKKVFILLVLCSIMSCREKTKEEKLKDWENRLRKFQANQKKSDSLKLITVPFPFDSSNNEQSKN